MSQLKGLIKLNLFQKNFSLFIIHITMFNDNNRITLEQEVETNYIFLGLRLGFKPGFEFFFQVSGPKLVPMVVEFLFRD